MWCDTGWCGKICLRILIHHFKSHFGDIIVLKRTLSPMPRLFLEDASRILKSCQSQLRSGQGRLSSPRLWRSFKASLYAPMTPDDNVHRLREVLEASGYVVWGVIVDADVEAFGDDDQQSQHWGRVMYCTDPGVELTEVIAVSDRIRHLLMLGDDVEEFMSEGAVYEFLQQVIYGEGVNQIVEVPHEITEGLTIFCVSLCVERASLPQGFIRRRVLPLVIDPKISDFAVVFGSRSWPEGLKSLWAGESFQLLREEGVSHEYNIEANPRAIDSVENALKDGADGDYLIASLHELAGLLLEVSRREVEGLLTAVTTLAKEEYVSVEQRGELCRFLASFLYQGVECDAASDLIYDHVRGLALPLQEFLPALLDRSRVDEEQEALRTFEMLEAVPCSPRILLESFTSLVLGIVGNRELLRRLLADMIFVDMLSKLAFYFSVLEPIEEIAGALFEQDIVVIHVPSMTGFLLYVDNITTTDKLHELLLEVFSRDMESSEVVRWRRYALDDASDPGDLVMIESSLAMWNWAALQGDGQLPESEDDPARVLNDKGYPADIPEFNGKRILLLGDATRAQRWRVSGFYQDIGEPMVRIKKRFTQDEVGGYLGDILMLGRLQKN